MTKIVSDVEIDRAIEQIKDIIRPLPAPFARMVVFLAACEVGEAVNKIEGLTQEEQRELYIQAYDVWLESKNEQTQRPM